MPKERRQNLTATDRGLYYNREKWLEEFLDHKGTFCNGPESEDNEYDDENYAKNIEVVVCRCPSK